MSSSDIFALRKQGNSRQALEVARREFGDGSSDIWLLRAYAWVLYDHAKQCIEAYETKSLSPTAMSAELSGYMREFANMGNPLRSDTAFSQMIRLAGKASKDWQEFLLFARWAGVNDFSADDRAPYTTDDGKTIDSLEKRFIRAICRETAAKTSDSQADRDLIDWGQSILDQALRSDPNDQWLNYYQSKLHLARGESELAIKRLAPVLQRQSRAAWPWSLLGEIFEGSRMSDAITCYGYATQVAREEQEVGKTRIYLAQILSRASRFEEAAKQAQLALSYREQHGYKVPGSLKQLLDAEWYQQATMASNLKDLPDMRSQAKGLLQELNRQNLTYVKGVIDHINTDKELSYVATSSSDGIAILHRKFPEIAALSPGTMVEVGKQGPETAPADWRRSETTTIPGLCESFSGQLERHEGKNFAFIRTSANDVFVPPDLARKFSPGRQYMVTCFAIKRTNKQGKTGWRAVRIQEEKQELAVTIEGNDSI